MFLQSLGALLPVSHQLPCRCFSARPNDADFDVSKQGLGFHRWDWDGLLGSHRYVHYVKVPTGLSLTMLYYLCTDCSLIALRIGANPVANADLGAPWVAGRSPTN